MALSNWDCLAFDSAGSPCDGELVIPSGAAVTIYKNWLYVRHPSMWTANGGYIKPTIAEIQHGEINIAGFTIIAARHPDQNSVFVFAEHIEYPDKDDYSKQIPYRMAGIGCYGFMDDLECLKNTYPEEYKRIPDKYLDPEKYDYTRFSNYPSGEWGFSFYGELDHFQIQINAKKPDLDDMWCGVNLKTSVAFLEWLKKVAPAEYFEKIKLNNARRFNQGDAYFASQLGTELPTSEIGKSTSPIFNQIIKSWESDEST